MNAHYAGILQLPVEILYEVQLIALSEHLPISCQRLRDVYAHAPISVRTEYLLSRCLGHHGFRQFDSKLLSRALRYPICTAQVLTLLLRNQSAPQTKLSVELPRRLFRTLEPRAAVGLSWRASDAPLPFLKTLYGLAKPDTNAQEGYALSRAVYAGHTSLVRFLLAHGAQPGHKDAFAVHVAIRRKDLTLVRTLIEPDYISPSTVLGKRPRGLCTNATAESDDNGGSPVPGKRRRMEDRVAVDKRMLHAAQQAGCDELVQYFLEKGCVPDMKTLLMRSSMPAAPSGSAHARRGRPAVTSRR